MSAIKPAPMRWWMTYPMTIVDTIFKALAPAMPDQVIAGHHADLVIAKMSGKHPRDGRLFIYTGGLIGGGWGAKEGEDGVSATIAINDGDTHNSPTEQVEAKYPLLVEALSPARRLGRTRARGAAASAPSRWCARSARSASTRRSSGSNAGPGACTAGCRRPATRWRCIGSTRRSARSPPARCSPACSSPATSTYCAPAAAAASARRSTASWTAIEHDVRQGYVSLRAAREQYGAVIDPATGRADLAASAGLRASMRAAGLPADQPFAADPNVPKYRPGAISLSGDEPKAAALKAATQAAGLDDRCCT